MTAPLDELIEHAAEPAWARRVVEALADAGHGDRLADPGVARAVVTAAGSSRLLGRLLTGPAPPGTGGLPHPLEVLADLDRPLPPPVTGPALHRRPEGRSPPPPTGPVDPADPTAGALLARWKELEWARIAVRDLLGLDTLEETTSRLAALATDVLAAAVSLAAVEHPAAGGLVVVGMGKLAGDELNYASDIDVMFVGSPGRGAERAARHIMRVAATCFRVDANLRPEGRNGALVRSLESYETYWTRWAEPWEFQALLKARPVAGPPEPAEAFAEAAGRHLWGRTFTADDLRQLRHLKARAEAEATGRDGDRDLKRAPGGIRDVEFACQLLQLVHGRSDPQLRTPNTLEALGELSAAGYVDPADASAMAAAYRFLRMVEHRLQLVDGHQTHALPGDPVDLERLARTCGFHATPEAGAAESFLAVLGRHRAATRSVHERLYFRPLLEAFTSTEPLMSAEAAAERLAAFGFTDADRTREAVIELTRGLTRASRLMHQMLPLLLGWLSDTPDPDAGLLALRHLASGPTRATALTTAFRESPELARRLCVVVGTSRLLAGHLTHNPDLIADLGDDRALAPPRREALAEHARTAVQWRAELPERQRGLKRFTDRQGLRIGAADVLGLADVRTTARSLTTLAEVALDAALASLGPTLPFAVVALGRFAGAELSYASDLDVIFVYEGDGPDAFAEAERLAVGLRRFVHGTMPSQRIYELDLDLRPEGRHGPLARSLEGYATYFARWAEVWERQAMSRARPVAGDPRVGARFMELLDDAVWGRPLSPAEVREIRRMKARVERERIPAGEDPQFHLKLGRGSLSDVEWAAQLLQLLHGIREPSTLGALDQLEERGVLGAGDAAALREAYEFCERTRNRLFLVESVPGDSLPTQPDRLARLARSLDMTPSELREEYRRVTRRARRVFERVFYGRK